MSATSGIGVSPELTEQFADAVRGSSVRFLKISIRNETLVPDEALPPGGAFEHDLAKLQTLLEDDVPAYVLARLDDGVEWLAIFYVPDTAKIRDKMLYASTRNSLTKSLGSSIFTDSIFANSKADLTPTAYAAHKRHVAAPKPLSAREQEAAEARAAEKEAGSTYEGSRARVNHIGTGVGLKWTPEVEQAVEDLGTGEESKIIVLSSTPRRRPWCCPLRLISLWTKWDPRLPTSEPSFAFFAWPHDLTSPPRREIVFIYSCPSSSPIKHRMLYSSGASSVFQTAKTLLASSSSVLAARKVETSDPAEINAAFLTTELGLEKGAAAGGFGPIKATPADNRAFAKPRGPVRKR